MVFLVVVLTKDYLVLYLLRIKSKKDGEMGAQLNIFDSMQGNLLILLKEKQSQLARLNTRLKSAQQELNSYDPDDYEDRREINACNQQIRDLEQQIKQTESEIANLTNQISQCTKLYQEFNKPKQR